MAVPVNYDVGAGEYLSTLLAQLNDKLRALAELRASRRSAQLDCDPGQWRGTARGCFENGGGEFAIGTGYAFAQQQLADLASAALRIKGQVDQANQDAIDAQRKPASAVGGVP
jgi:hypothetical protein